jgi:hypothetical protein
MASTIPRTRRRAYANTLAAKTLYVALFTNATGYDPVAATNTYTTFAASATEVSASGTGYTTGGYALTLTPSDTGATNVSKVSATATTIASATFSFSYAVVYDHTSGNIEGVIDMLGTYTVNTGTITLTYNATLGLFNIA